MTTLSLTGNASGAGAFTVAAPNSANTRTLTLPDGTGTFTVNGVNSNIVSGTAVASTSGTSIDFTSIPSWVKRITVMLQGVSTSGTSLAQIQIGAGSVTTSGYLGSVGIYPTASASTFTSGFGIDQQSSAAAVRHGAYTIQAVGSNAWVCTGVVGYSHASAVGQTGGTITLGGTLDRVRITTVNGTDTFDAGSINILYE